MSAGRTLRGVLATTALGVVGALVLLICPVGQPPADGEPIVVALGAAPEQVVEPAGRRVGLLGQVHLQMAMPAYVAK